MGGGAAPVPTRPPLILRQIPSDAISYLSMTACHLRFHRVFTSSRALRRALTEPPYVSWALNHRAKMPEQSLMSTVQISGRYHRYPDCS
ncbi:hypothetical protein GCM10010332_59630 [Streptomyces albogriseolus]|nr:hypothetical protein GCM10010332_59630 [Streptomyces albogriseolus]